MVTAMTKTFILLLALSGCAAAPTALKSGPQPDGSMLVVISPEHWKTCQQEGGCSLFSGQRLQNELEEAFMAGASTCKKPARQL